MKIGKVLLALILILGLFLRFTYLGRIPAGFSPDEASQAYSAYSLLQTGKDEWGLGWPISSFKSFLDYKAPLQTYLMIPSVAIFGLNEFAARLPSAIFGVLAILAIYLLTGKIFPNYKHLPLYSALFLALSPWHIQFSRTALEVNLTSFLFPLGLYLYLRGLKDHRQFIYTAILWGLSLYAYHSAKIYIPLFAFSLLFLYRRQIFSKGFKPLLPALLTIIILLGPLALGTFFGNSAKRGGDLLVSKLDTVNLKQIDDQSFYSPLAKINPKIPRLFHRKIFTVISRFGENYLSYFSLPFWFTEGGREITYSVIPGRGLLLFWMLPLVLFGLFLLLKKIKDEDYDARPILLWLLLAAVPAALTKEGYRPNRAGSFLCLWEIIAAFGFVRFLEIKNKYSKKILGLFIGLAIILTGFYFEDYFFNSVVTYPKALSYGWRDTVNAISKIQRNYDTVMVDKGTQGQSFIAFYLKTPPPVFQAASADWEKEMQKNPVDYLDQMGKYRLGKYSFEKLDWPEDKNLETLYVWQGNSLLPSERHTLHQVTTPTGEIIMEVFDFKQ